MGTHIANFATKYVLIKGRFETKFRCLVVKFFLQRTSEKRTIYELFQNAGLE